MNDELRTMNTERGEGNRVSTIENTD